MPSTMTHEDFRRELETISKAYIFGTTKPARHLYQLILESGNEGKLLGFIVTKKENNPDELLGRKVFLLDEVVDKAAAILMTVSLSYHPEAYTTLSQYGFLNVHDCFEYYMLSTYEDSLISRESLYDKNIKLTNQDRLLREEILDLALKENATFDNQLLYQSFPSLGIKGTRNTQFRIDSYHLYDYTSEQSAILDIGCNYGFLDIEIASQVKSVTGIEYSDNMVRIARMISDKFGIKNTNFCCGDFKDWCRNAPKHFFSVVFSFSVHLWLDISPKDYVKTILELLCRPGIVFMESHGYGDIKYAEYIDEFMKNGFVVCEQFSTEDPDGMDVLREMSILRIG